jgi:cytochrome c biogenesis protein CcmG/thiol:disulfide interchange protein DsbE
MARNFARSGLARVLLVFIPVLALLAVLGIATYRGSSAPEPGEPVPGFTAPLLAGSGELALEDLAGKPLVLNFWASWCVPCEDEAPMLREAYERHGDAVHFVGVDIRDARSDALAFIEKHDLRFPSVRDEDLGIYRDYGLTGQPETFFIDADGILVEHVAGPLTDDRLAELVDLLLRRDA